jgi:hypothetical protein
VIQTCSQTSECIKNHVCKTYDAMQCPPGFDCSQKVCLELPQCLTDGDCVTGIGPNQMRTGYCDEGHCQPSTKCVIANQCASNSTCVAETCVPKVCRGHSECGPQKACVDAKCIGAPLAGDVTALKVSPLKASLLVGQLLQLQVVALSFNGTTFPMRLSTAQYQVLDSAGMPSTLATVTSAGLVTAIAPGAAKIKVSTGTALAGTMDFTVIPAATTKRVRVVDAQGTGLIANVHACQQNNCVDVTSDNQGIATFATFASGGVSYTAISQTQRTDSLPRYERTSILNISSDDVVILLRDNPVNGQANFSAAVSFNDVNTRGNYWAGFVTTSNSDLTTLTPQTLVGENFLVEVPGVGQRVPLPSSLVLYTSPGLNVPQEIKPRSLNQGQSGNRFSTAWAGRTQLTSLTSVRSTDLLGYLGAFDFALEPNVSMVHRPFVTDTSDINGNGLCGSPSKCPMGTEDVADYANAVRLTSAPKRSQQRRTEVVIPKLPGIFDTVVAAAIEFDEFAGVIPTGFASATLGAAGTDGLKTVTPISLRSGPPYNGVEISNPGLWVFATDTQSGSLSARIATYETLPERILVRPLLPIPQDASYTVATRTVNLGQPSWNSIVSSGGEMGRLTIRGSTTQHCVYFAAQAAQNTVSIPLVSGASGADPATESAINLELVAFDLVDMVSYENFHSSAQGKTGRNVLSPSSAVDGYSRFEK